MTANRDLPNTSFNYVLATRSGSGSDTRVSVSVNNTSTVPYMLSGDGFSGVASVSLEQIFCPISYPSGGIFPYLEKQYEANDTNYGLIPTTGNEEQVSQDKIISRDSDENKRFLGLKLPMYVAGRGFDNYDDAVGGSESFDILNYKAGQVDLRWDDESKTWGGRQLIKGYLSSDITKATGRNKPSSFTIKTYKLDNQSISSISSIENSSGKVKITVSQELANLQEFSVGDRIEVTNSSESTYNVTHTITSLSDRVFGELPTSFVTDIDYVSSSTNEGNYTFIVSDNKYVFRKEITVMNYDPYFSIDLLSKCNVSSDQTSCDTVEADILVIVTKIGGEYLPVYIGCPHE